MLRAWVRPEGLQFRRAVWDRVKVILPDQLDHAAFAAAEKRVSDLVEGIERGRAWPGRGSPEAKMLARALDHGSAFFDPAILHRLEAVAPEEVKAALRPVGRPRRG